MHSGTCRIRSSPSLSPCRSPLFLHTLHTVSTSKDSPPNTRSLFSPLPGLSPSSRLPCRQASSLSSHSIPRLWLRASPHPLLCCWLSLYLPQKYPVSHPTHCPPHAFRGYRAFGRGSSQGIPNPQGLPHGNRALL